MQTLKENLAKLVKVKTVVTLTVIAIFAVLALRKDIDADNVMTTHTPKPKASLSHKTTAKFTVTNYGKPTFFSFRHLF